MKHMALEQITEHILKFFFELYFDQMWVYFSADLKSKAFANSYIPF